MITFKRAAKIVIFFLLAMSFQIHSMPIYNKRISLDLQNVGVQDALHILAKFMNINIVITQKLEGTVTLRLQNSSSLDAFDLLLASHHLTKSKIGTTWVVGSNDEFLLNKQEELKLKNASDEAATLITRTWKIRYAKADDLAHLIQDNTNSLLSTRGRVRVDMRTNILCVQDITSRLSVIENLIKKLDVPVQQILIETRLASIDTDFERELGINFNVQSPLSSASNISSFSSTMSKHYSLAVVKLADSSLLDVQLSALENEGHGELISSPSLFTANQQTASIESGEEIPYQETSQNGATSTVFKKAVLSLKVTPQILPDNQVLLQLQINQDKPNKRIVLGVPAISTRQMSTHVLLRSGQTIVLGGIYE